MLETTEMTTNPAIPPFYKNAPVEILPEATHHDRPFERGTAGMFGQVVDFGDPQDYDNIIVSFPDLDEFGAYHKSMLRITTEIGGEI